MSTTREQDIADFDVALQEYKKKHGRMFPTCSEILEVAQAIGFEKVTNEMDDPTDYDDAFEGDEELELALEQGTESDEF